MNGMPADLDAFADIAARTGVKVVYDAAHAVGTLYKGRKMGPAGEMSVYSFQANKNMSTLGEGGMVTTDNPEYHARLQRIKSFGFKYGPVDDVLEWGSNYRMSKLQSAVGLTQLARWTRRTASATGTLATSRSNWRMCRRSSRPSTTGRISARTISTCCASTTRPCHAGGFPEAPQGQVQGGGHVPLPPLWNFSFYRDMGYGPERPVAARVLRQLFNAPVFPRITPEDVDYVVWAIKQSIAELRRSPSALRSPGVSTGRGQG